MSDYDDLQEYIKTGEIRSHLSMKASMVMSDASRDWKGARAGLAGFERRWLEVYALVYADITAIQFAAKEFEFRHWMGFCDEDVEQLMQEYRQWTFFDWERASKEAGDAMRDKWNPHPKGIKDYDKDQYWREHWQQHIDRRDKKPLQEIYKESPSFLSNHKGGILDRLVQAVSKVGGNYSDEEAFVAENIDVRLGGSAGRVLLTLQDRVKRDDPKNVFD